MSPLTFALRARRAPDARLVLSLVLACAAIGCAPEIGDECETALDCSSQGSRLCDRTQPGGYCTIQGCERGSCPEEAVCVRFRPEVERLSTTYCMYACDDDDDCRDDEGYHCTKASEFGNGNEAEILGRAGQGFCSIPVVERDGPMSLPDGGVAGDGAERPDAAADGG